MLISVRETWITHDGFLSRLQIFPYRIYEWSRWVYSALFFFRSVIRCFFVARSSLDLSGHIHYTYIFVRLPQSPSFHQNLMNCCWAWDGDLDWSDSCTTWPLPADSSRFEVRFLPDLLQYCGNYSAGSCSSSSLPLLLAKTQSGFCSCSSSAASLFITFFRMLLLQTVPSALALFCCTAAL